MHILENTQPIPLGKPGVLPPGRWLVQDQNAFEMGLMGERGSVTLTKIPNDMSPQTAINLLLLRSGAIGDLLLLSPAVRAFRAKHPQARITLCRFSMHAGLFDETGIFDDYADYPLPVSGNYDTIFSLENVLELNPTVHATDCFAAALGVTVTDYKPSYFVRNFEHKDAERYLKRSDRPKLAVQLLASANNRNYPMPLWKKVIDALILNGWHVILFGSPELTAKMNHGKFMTPLVGHFRECAAVFAGCTAFVGVDSVWSHMCHALDVPGVVLYGAFDPATRTGKNPGVTALVGQGPCAPCSHHIHAGNHFPRQWPCAQKQVCSVLGSINPATVISAVNRLKP